MNIDFQKLVIQKHVIDSSTHEKSKKLSVAYGVDRNFLFGSGISMTSVLVNNPDIDIHFYIVTDYIDDEKPLYVDVDNKMNITGFLDNSDSCKYISGGIYGLTPKAIDTLESCVDAGQSRMRNFQRQLVTDNLNLKAFPFAKIVDVDHAEDIKKAEQFVKNKDVKN